MLYQSFVNHPEFQRLAKIAKNSDILKSQLVGVKAQNRLLKKKTRQIESILESLEEDCGKFSQTNYYLRGQLAAVKQQHCLLKKKTRKVEFWKNKSWEFEVKADNFEAKADLLEAQLSNAQDELERLRGTPSQQ